MFSFLKSNTHAEQSLLSDCAGQVVSKLFHDLASPLGAADNALEMMSMLPDSQKQDCADIIASSLQQAVGRLVLARLVFVENTIGMQPLSDLLHQLQPALKMFNIDCKIKASREAHYPASLLAALWLSVCGKLGNNQSIECWFEHNCIRLILPAALDCQALMAIIKDPKITQLEKSDMPLLFLRQHILLSKADIMYEQQKDSDKNHLFVIF